MPTERAVIINRITAERARQERSWSCQNDGGQPGARWALPEAMKLCVLAEEVGEVARALNDGAANELRDELVQVAAVCLRWLGDGPEDVWFFDGKPSRPTGTPNEPAKKLARLAHYLGALATADGNEGEYLLRCAYFCVCWLEQFDDDPLVDAEKRRVREGATNAWRPA